MVDVDRLIYEYVSEPLRWGQKYLFYVGSGDDYEQIIADDDSNLLRVFDELWSEYLTRDVPTYSEPEPVSGEIEWR